MKQKEKELKNVNFLCYKRMHNQGDVIFLRQETEMEEANALLSAKRLLTENKFIVIEHCNIDFGFNLDTDGSKIISKEYILINTSMIFEVSYHTHLLLV